MAGQLFVSGDSRYTVKNFRTFSSDGASFRMKPITIMTGCNGCGKSSMVKSMILLDSFLDSARKDFASGSDLDIWNYRLDFGIRPNDKLSSMERVISRNSLTKDLSFCYEVQSKLLGETVTATLCFLPEQGSKTGNGQLDSITLVGPDKKLLFYQKRGQDPVICEDILKPYFERFVLYANQLHHILEKGTCELDVASSEKEAFFDNILVYAKRFKGHKSLLLGKINNDTESIDAILSSPSSFSLYVQELLSSVLALDIPDCVSYMEISSVEVKKSYPLDSNSGMSEILNRYFTAREHFLGSEHNGEFIPGIFINTWLKRLKIGDRLSLILDDDKREASIKVFKREDDNEGYYLHEQGYGVAQLVTILLRIETAILESYRLKCERVVYTDKEEAIVENGTFHFPVTIAVEEPEVHLHPMIQSRLADLFLDAYSSWNIRFIVETHSEYMIRRSQVIVNESAYSDYDECDRLNPFEIYYVPIDGQKPYALQYRPDGKFMNDFGTGFFDEADNLVFKIL